MSQQDSSKKIHQGRNIKRFREMLGIKQEAFAEQLGEDWTQRRVSLLEAKEEVDEDILLQVASALKVPKEAIENFDEQSAVTYFNTFNDSSSNQGVLGSFNDQSSFILNPIEKWLQALEENKKLYQEKIELYERMLKDRDGMIEELKKLK